MRTDYGYFEEKHIGKAYDLKMLKKLVPFIRPYRVVLIGSVVLVILITLLDLALPYATKIAIDRFILPIAPASGLPGNTHPTVSSRYLIVDLGDERIASVVQKYPSYFRKDNTTAVISREDLKKIEAPDLMILRRDDIGGLTLMTAAFLLIILTSFGLNFLQVMIMEYNGQMIMHDLRVELFTHIQDLSIAFFNRNPVGRLVTRTTNDIQNMHELFTSVIVFIFKDLFLLIGIAVVLLSISWKLALVSFSVMPLVLYASFKFSTHAREVFRTLRIKIAEINTKIAETLGGMAVIQMFNQEKENSRRFEYLNHEYYQAGMRQIRLFAVFMPVIELLGMTALAIVIFYGGAGVLGETLSLGALVAFISYVKMFFRPIRDIAEKYNILQNAMASAERIFLLLDTDEKIVQTAKSLPATAIPLEQIREIEFKDISFGYLKDEPVLHQLNLKVCAGETVAVVGPTGSGKTTLVNLIPRFYDPTAGDIFINGRNLRQYDISALRAKIALVTQDPFLFSQSIRDNILPGDADIDDQELSSILASSNCRALIAKLPLGLDTVLAEGGISISSGERQLLSIARAFAHHPDLIILDEATSYIDSETEKIIQDALDNLIKSRTAIVVAHRLTTARHADRIVVLNRGRIIESGPHEKLMQQKGFYYRLSRFQS